MSGAVNNIMEKEVETALTGPILRGDIGTIEKHREILGEFKNVYDELGKIALSIASENGSLSETKIKQMNNILGGNEYEKNSGNL
jgi:hypothetical protein